MPLEVLYISWDSPHRVVFLQLLEFYGDHERAKEVLVDYAEKNVANINAHKYMYNLYQRHDSDSSEKIETLQVTTIQCYCFTQPLSHLAIHYLNCTSTKACIQSSVCVLHSMSDITTLWSVLYFPCSMSDVNHNPTICVVFFMFYVRCQSSSYDMCCILHVLCPMSSFYDMCCILHALFNVIIWLVLRFPGSNPCVAIRWTCSWSPLSISGHRCVFHKQALINLHRRVITDSSYWILQNHLHLQLKLGCVYRPWLVKTVEMAPVWPSRSRGEGDHKYRIRPNKCTCSN